MMYHLYSEAPIPSFNPMSMCPKCNKYRSTKNLNGSFICTFCRTPIIEYSEIRSWWHDVIRSTERVFPSYATFLFLPSDGDAIKYFTDFYDEVEIMSGENCCLLALTNKDFKLYAQSKDEWVDDFNLDVTNGYSAKLAQTLFGKDFNDFPCVLLFDDLRSRNCAVISLKELATYEISFLMRDVFHTINTAVSKRKKPIKELQKYMAVEKGRGIAVKITDETIKIITLSFEAVMEAFIKAFIKP